MSEPREFPNPYPEYNGEALLSEQGELLEKHKKRLKDNVSKLLGNLERRFETEADPNDYTVYTGLTGIALLYFHMYEKFGMNEEHLHRALDILRHPLRHLKRRRVSFLCGDPGPLALGAVVYDKLGSKKDRDDCLSRLFDRHKDLKEPSLPDEMLFGRAGYLFSLLFVQKHLGTDVVDGSIIEKTVQMIVTSGQNLSRQERSSCPLMYEWHEKKYLGAAHGLVGIFYMLMKVQGAELQDLIKPSIDFLLKLKYPSGNFPSSIGSSTGDKLVHWCHGAPGWIHMFVLAYKTYGESRFLDAARSCAEVIWKRGLLRKGYGICHGTGGNAYAFLAMYKLTKEDKYLYRALKFAEWCFDYGKHGCRIPDRPLSLFEGLAGTIFFLVDLLDPANAKFPAFDL